MSFCLNHWSVLFPLQDLMPIHCCAMQGRIDAIQALLFFDTAGSIKQSLETEDEVLEIIYIFSSRRNCRCWNLCGIQKHCRWWNLCGIHFCALVWNNVWNKSRWQFYEISTVLCVVCIKKAMYKLKSSISKGYWIVYLFLTQFNIKCCSMLFLSNRNHRQVCLICPLQMTSLIVPNGEEAWWAL